MGDHNSNQVLEDAIGQVKFFKRNEGYGFIKVLKPEQTQDVFFHISEYKASQIHKDWWFRFDISDANRGKKAVNMRRISQPPEHELKGTSFNY